MRIAVINESHPTYNLATHRMLNLFSREGHEVLYSPHADMWSCRCDKAYVSIIFTWNLPEAVQDIRNLLAAGVEVEVGGPAATALPKYIESTGVKPHIGLDQRFEHVSGDDYKATFTSRGCPRACKFCIVKDMEGRQMIEYEDYPIPTGDNPYVCDNSILMTSWEHQVRMVERLKEIRNLDLNSGFDDRIFVKNMERYYALYKQLHMEAWRFAYDKPEQRKPVGLIAEFLHDKGVDYRRITVFCLVGYETTFQVSRERLQYLVDIGVSPYPMRYRPLTSVDKHYTPPGWNSKDMAMLFGYYGVPWRWRTCAWEEYQVDYKAGAISNVVERMEL